MKVYVVVEKYGDEDGRWPPEIIGVFSTKERAFGKIEEGWTRVVECDIDGAVYDEDCFNSNLYDKNSIYDKIKQRAHQIYIERGSIDGFAEQDWECAEKEILDRAETQSLSYYLDYLDGYFSNLSSSKEQNDDYDENGIFKDWG